MGHREDLLEGAKQCLYEKGYARTTARDIVAASNTNLASIGYHFGSKEALLDAALIDAASEMSEELVRLTSNAAHDGRTPDAEPDLAGAWSRGIEQFSRYRQLLIAQVEAWAQIERSPGLRAKLSDHYEADRERGVVASKRAYPGVDDRTARAISAITMALADGLVVQWLLDPDRAPTAEDVALGIRALAGVASNDPTPDGDED